MESILIEINENYLEQLDSVVDIMNKYDFILKSKVRLGDNKNTKFLKTYNYIFNKKI